MRSNINVVSLNHGNCFGNFSPPVLQKLHIIILLALEVKFFGSRDPSVYFIGTFPEGERNTRKIYGTNNSLNYKRRWSTEALVIWRPAHRYRSRYTQLV